jgi:hypothetical protein
MPLMCGILKAIIAIKADCLENQLKSYVGPKAGLPSYCHSAKDFSSRQFGVTF